MEILRIDDFDFLYNDIMHKSYILFGGKNFIYTSRIINILIVVPCCMLSGVFWDFDIMEESLQKIGNYIPTRWVYICIENLQNGNDLNGIKIYLGLMILFSIILFAISFTILKFKNEL